MSLKISKIFAIPLIFSSFLFVTNNAFNKVNGQYEESARINNVYNRMILFDGNTQHAAQTFGSKTDRLTLNFFLKNITGPQQPFIRE